MTWIDTAMLLVIGFSAVLAMVRGFVREIFDLIAWAGAGAAAVKFYPVLLPEITSLLPAAMQNLGIYGAMGAVFLIVLVALSLIAALVGGLVRDSPLAGLDHALGFGLGAVRGGLVLCIAYIGLGFAEPAQNWPSAITDARFLPYVQEGAQALASLLPAHFQPKVYGLPTPGEPTPGESAPGQSMPGLPAPSGSLPGLPLSGEPAAPASAPGLPEGLAPSLAPALAPLLGNPTGTTSPTQ
jgi:membrane protein required for colicin V production